jgi:hypothetical protein
MKTHLTAIDSKAAAQGVESSTKLAEQKSAIDALATQLEAVRASEEVPSTVSTALTELKHELEGVCEGTATSILGLQTELDGLKQGQARVEEMAEQMEQVEATVSHIQEQLESQEEDGDLQGKVPIVTRWQAPPLSTLHGGRWTSLARAWSKSRYPPPDLAIACCRLLAIHAPTAMSGLSLADIGTLLQGALGGLEELEDIVGGHTEALHEAGLMNQEDSD